MYYAYLNDLDEEISGIGLIQECRYVGTCPNIGSARYGL